MLLKIYQLKTNSSVRATVIALKLQISFVIKKWTLLRVKTKSCTNSSTLKSA